MERINIIMFNMSSYSEWQHGVSNRNHHVLMELAKSERIGRILAVDYPPMTLKRAARNYKENLAIPNYRGEIVRRSFVDRIVKVSNNVYIYSNVEFFMRPHKFAKQVTEAARYLGFSDYIHWSFCPPVMRYSAGAGQKLSVFDAVDNWSEHPSYLKFRDRLLMDYDFIKKNADIIFTVSEDLQKLFDNQPNAYWVPNGVDITHYQNPSKIVSRDIADLPRPVIGYIGVVQDRVDIGLIKYLALKNPTKSFVIVGPVWHAADEASMKELSNIHLLGYKTYQEAPAYIHQFDIGIIPHKQTSFITSTNPMKMYEYLACGKPVVAMKGSGAEMFRDVVYIAKSAEDFNRKLLLALQEDDPEKRAARAAAVAHATWGSVVKQMLDIIQKKLTY